MLVEVGCSAYLFGVCTKHWKPINKPINQPQTSNKLAIVAALMYKHVPTLMDHSKQMVFVWKKTSEYLWIYVFPPVPEYMFGQKVYKQEFAHQSSTLAPNGHTTLVFSFLPSTRTYNKHFHRRLLVYVQRWGPVAGTELKPLWSSQVGIVGLRGTIFADLPIRLAVWISRDRAVRLVPWWL